MYVHMRVCVGYLFNVSQVGADTVVGFTLLTNETNQQRYGKIIKYATRVQVPMMVALQHQLCTQRFLLT
jgi:hypothetical protein